MCEIPVDIFTENIFQEGTRESLRNTAQKWRQVLLAKYFYSFYCIGQKMQQICLSVKKLCWVLDKFETNASGGQIFNQYFNHKN